MPESQNRNNLRYYRISLILMCVVNRVTYEAGRAIGHLFTPHDISLPVDARFPLIPWTFLIYNGCYLWWAWMFRFVSVRERKRADRFFAALILGHVICAVFFAFYPTTIARPELAGDSVWIPLLRMLYSIDEPNNLFPSVHCMIAWFCWIVIRGDRTVALKWRIIAFAAAIAVFVSTLTMRQHVILDIPGGIAVAEIAWLICKPEAISGLYARLADAIDRRLPRRKE